MLARGRPLSNELITYFFFQADSLTTKELDEYRKLVRGKLEEAGARVGKPVMHSFSSQDLEQAGEMSKSIAMSSKSQMNPAHNMFVLVYRTGYLIS